MVVGVGRVTWSEVLTTAVPSDRNSMVWLPHWWDFSSSRTPDDPGGVERFGLVLHAGHGQLPGLVQRLGEVGQLHVLARRAQRLAQSAMGDVVDAGPHDQALGEVAGLHQRPEVLARQVGGERLARACSDGTPRSRPSPPSPRR